MPEHGATVIGPCRTGRPEHAGFISLARYLRHLASPWPSSTRPNSQLPAIFASAGCDTMGTHGEAAEHSCRSRAHFARSQIRGLAPMGRRKDQAGHQPDGDGSIDFPGKAVERRSVTLKLLRIRLIGHAPCMPVADIRVSVIGSLRAVRSLRSPHHREGRTRPQPAFRGTVRTARKRSFAEENSRTCHGLLHGTAPTHTCPHAPDKFAPTAVFQWSAGYFQVSAKSAAKSR